MMDERTATATILGELIPQLEYAAPVLLERLDRGLPLVERKSPSDLGFDTGMIDAGLLELFRALAPYVTMVVGSKIFRILRDREERSQEEIRIALTQMQAQNTVMQQRMAEILKAMSRMAKKPVSEAEIQIEIARAIERIAIEQRAKDKT